MVKARRFYVPVGVVAYAGPPGEPQTGDTYFDTALGQLRSWDGTAWVGSSSDADSDAKYLNIDGGAVTGELSLPDQAVAPPSAPDVVSAKGYVDQLVTVSEVPPPDPPVRDGLVWVVAPFAPDSVPGLE